MNTLSFEGVVRQNQVQLPQHLHLPDDTKVVVIVLTEGARPTAHLYSPHLVNPALAADFALEVIEEKLDA